MSGKEFILDNYCIFREKTTNLGGLCAFFLQKRTLNSDELERIINPYTNASSEDKNDKLYELLMRKEITIELLKDSLKSSANSQLLETITWPSCTGGASSGKKIFWNVPRRNQMFVGRQDILAEISKAFKSKEKYKSVITTACKGLGGIGKTTIAVQYAWMHQNVKNVFWFAAEKGANMKSQMKELEKNHGVNNKWFECNEDWLIIFDNAENAPDLAEFIPNNSGQILITSRNIQWGESTLIEIDIFTPEEARNLSEEILQKEFNEYDEVDALGNELGHLPLALSIALYYIKNNVISISDYLDKFKERKTEMLQMDFKGFQILPSVYSTWMISYEKMMEEDPQATQFLVLCAYYPDPDKIPFVLLNYFVFLKTNYFTMFDNMREILIKYSMVKAEKSFFKIHRLVQQVLKIQFQRDEEANIFIFCRLSISDHLNSRIPSEV